MEMSASRSQEEQLPTVDYVREASISDEGSNQPLDATDGGAEVVYAEVDNVLPSSANLTGSAIRQSDAGRSIHFARHSISRASVRSDSGIHQDRVFNRHRPATHSTRRVHRENTDPVISFQALDNDEGTRVGSLRNSSSSLAQITIHQVCTPKLAKPGSTQLASQLSDNDIPGFKDPEIMGDSDSLERLAINLPPDIYSSQILRTVRSPDWEGMTAGDEECTGTNFQFIREKNTSTASLSGNMFLNPGIYMCGYR